MQPTSNVRMVQLFLNDETEPVFMEMLKQLGKRYGTGNITDTVFRAVMQEANRDALEGDP